MNPMDTLRRGLAPHMVLATMAAALLSAPALALAQSRLEQFRDRMGLDDGLDNAAPAPLPASVRLIRDVAYGPDKNQRVDVYLPAHPALDAKPAPVVFFVHGGAWARGDKAMARVVDPKMAHWVQRGWVAISTDYRMLPTPVATQADDVATAIAFAQSQAASWGADAARFVLMGHSAGAHLVALIAAGAPTSASPRLQPWRGAVLLDSAVLDLPLLMGNRHLPLYDRAFGTDPQQWSALSPYAAMTRATAPLLAVCSSRRKESCMQADRFVAHDQVLGGHARVLREDLSHAEINATLGADSQYTAQVDAFIDSLR